MDKCSVRAMVAEVQDGNDLFYALPHPVLASPIKRGVLTKLGDISEFFYVDAEADKQGKDANFLVPFDSLSSMSNIVRMLDLRIIEELVIDGVRVIILSDQDDVPHLNQPRFPSNSQKTAGPTAC